MGGDGGGDPRRHDAQPCEGLVEGELAQAPPPWPLAPGLREPNSAYASAALRQPRGTPGRSWRIEAATQAELARLYAEHFQVHARNDVPAHRVALSDRWPSCASPWDWIDREARVIAMTSRRSPSWPRCPPVQGDTTRPQISSRFCGCRVDRARRPACSVLGFCHRDPVAAEVACRS